MVRTLGPGQLHQHAEGGQDALLTPGTLPRHETVELGVEARLELPSPGQPLANRPEER